MPTLIERIVDHARFERELANDCDMRPEDTQNWERADDLEHAVARILDLEAALRPFARFWEAQQLLGRPTPTTGDLFVAHGSVDVVRSISVEDLKHAHHVLGEPGR